MKILLGIPEYPPYHVGGGGEVYKQLAENYKKLGHDVVVIYGYYKTKSWNEKIKEYVDDAGIKFYQIPEIPYPKSMPFLRTVMLPNFKAWKQLKKIIKKENPDVAHLHGYGLPFINILSKILYNLGIKYIFTIHGYPETQNKSNIIVRLVWNIYVKFIMNKTLRNADVITCVSDYIKNDSRNIYQNKSVTIYNGINLKDYETVGNNINLRKKYNIDNDELIIFSLGRISEMKGFQEVIKIMPKLKDSGIKIKYLIAGNDDGYKYILEKKIEMLGLQDNVVFVGFLDLEDKKQYLQQCDIFAIPSLWEPFGLVALEGIVFNKVILTTEIGGLKEILSNYKRKINIYDENITNVIKLNRNIFINNKYIPKKFTWKYIVNIYLDKMF